jgi:hypothetical protein
MPANLQNGRPVYESERYTLQQERGTDNYLIGNLKDNTSVYIQGADDTRTLEESFGMWEAPEIDEETGEPGEPVWAGGWISDQAAQMFDVICSQYDEVME